MLLDCPVTTKAHGLSFHYNESDTFQPAGLERNLFLEALPLPVGEGKDYGFTYSMFEDKFVLRVNWYDSAQAFSRAGAGLVTGRARRVENEGQWGFVDMIERDIETAIYTTLPDNLDRLLRRHPLKCPVAFIGGRGSEEMKQVGMALTQQVTQGRIMMLDGSHLFPMERPAATAAQRGSLTVPAASSCFFVVMFMSIPVRVRVVEATLAAGCTEITPGLAFEFGSSGRRADTRPPMQATPHTVAFTKCCVGRARARHGLTGWTPALRRRRSRSRGRMVHCEF